jgi:hypothetical protein
MAFVSYRGMLQRAEELTIIVRAMPPVVAGCHPFGDLDRGQDNDVRPRLLNSIGAQTRNEVEQTYINRGSILPGGGV